jgi:hypothetical protein
LITLYFEFILIAALSLALSLRERGLCSLSPRERAGERVNDKLRLSFWFGFSCKKADIMIVGFFVGYCLGSN